jgi:hypothetical protein
MDGGRFILYLGDMPEGSKGWNERDLVKNYSCKTWSKILVYVMRYDTDITCLLN